MSERRDCYGCRGSGKRTWVNHHPWDGMTKEKKVRLPCELCGGERKVPDTNESLDRAILEKLDISDGFSASEVAGGLIGATTAKVAGRLRSLARRKLVKGLAPAPWEGQWPGAPYGVWMWYREPDKD